MKTAMQEWFDELKANYPYMANEIFDKGFNKYLEKEKEQIKNAHIEGTEHGYRESHVFGIDARPYSGKRAEEYYNQTFNQNK